MMQHLYEISYISLLISALMWFFMKSRQVSALFFGRSFWISLLLYIVSLFFEEASLILKLFLMLPLDIAIFVTLLLLFNRYVSKSKILFTLVAIAMLVVKFFVVDRLKPFFQESDKPLVTETIDRNSLAAFSSSLIPLDPEGELLLDIADHISEQELAAYCRQRNIGFRKAFPHLHKKEYSTLDHYYVLDLPEPLSQSWQQEAQALIKAGLADWVEANEKVSHPPVKEARKRSDSPNYGLNDPGLVHLWGFKAMQMDAFFQLLKDTKASPAKKALIAILDTGVDSEHEDLADNYRSVNKKYDADAVGHGTHCAGIAGAVANNGKGIASFAPDSRFVEITSIKVLGNFGGGTQQSVIAGIIEAADLGADVISMSLGGPTYSEAQKAYTEAIKYARKSGAIVVVAAGNSDEDARDYSPANIEGVITVAALDETLRKAEFSNTVDGLRMGIAAPGVNIYSSFPGNEYKSLSGTSMATPYVAGLLGLARSLRPGLQADEAYTLLQSSALSAPDGAKTGKLIQPYPFLKSLLAAK